MAHRGIIFGTKPDKSAPADWLDPVLKEFNSYYTITFVDIVKNEKGEEETYIYVKSGTGQLTLKDIEGIQKELLKEEVFLHLGKVPDGFSGDHLQPFVVASEAAAEGSDKPGDPVIITLMEGDFTRFAESKTGGSPAYNAFYDNLLPRLAEILEATEGDLDKFMDKVTSPITSDDITNLNSNNGLIVLMASNGTVARFEKTDLVEKDWGWTSLDLGTSKSVIAESKKSLLATAGDRLAGLIGKKPGEVEVAQVGDTTVVVPKKPDGTEDQPDVGDPPQPAPQRVMRKEYPPHHYNNKDLRNWYNKKLGMVPQDWKSKPYVEVWEDQPSKSFDEAAQALKDQQVTADNLVMIPPKQKESVLAMFANNEVVKKTLDTSGTVISDPKYLDGVEKPVPSAAEQLGMKGGLELFFTTERPQLLAWVKAYPEFATNLLDDFRYAYIKTLKAEDLARYAPAKPDAAPAATVDKPKPKLVVAGRRPPPM